MRRNIRQDAAANMPRKTRWQTRRSLMALTAAIVLGAFFGSVPAKANAESEAFIREKVDVGYAILGSTTLSTEERGTQFHDFMLSLTDMRRIAMFTLGPYVNRAPEADINDFVEAFTDYAVTVYDDNLSKYSGQTIMVSRSEDPAADDSIVHAIVQTPNNEIDPNRQSINVAFRVRKDANGNSIVIDMQVEGVWLAVNQRADFTSFLQQNNGSVPALSASLRRQAEQIRNSNDS
jgi:phospholipid transport system substrate-binding protein